MEEQAGWVEHARFMDELVRDGFVIFGGPIADSDRVMLVCEAESEEGICAALGDDPWSGSHLAIESVERWTMRLGGRRN